ncbi:MAG: DUF4476 domain-containing protein [Ferruginibacter sp.]
MKKIFTLTTTLFLTISLFAFSPKSILSISSNSRKPVRVAIDNRNWEENNSNEVVVRDIRSGYHNIKVFSSGNKSYNRKAELIYNGNVYVKPGFHVDITINRFGKALIDERKISSTYYGDDEDNTGWNDDAKQPMNANEFDQLKQTISNGNFENTKLSIAKQTISSNYFSATQVKEMLGLFSFDNSKLEIAKATYRNCIDKGNYFIVTDALVFSSSKEELAKFLETSR